MTPTHRGKAVAVYCASSIGRKPAFHNAALCACVRVDWLDCLTSVRVALGHSLAGAECPLVYGGGSLGIMGIVSAAVLKGGGKVTGIVPYAMVNAGGEGSGGVEAALSDSDHVALNDREKVSG